MEGYGAVIIVFIACYLFFIHKPPDFFANTPGIILFNLLHWYRDLQRPLWPTTAV